MTGEARVTGPSCSTSMNRICCSSAIGRRRHCMPSLINSSSPCLGLLSSMRCDSGIREAMRAATPHFTFTRLSRPQRCRRPCERASYRDRRPPPGRLIVPRPHALRWHFRWCTDCFACETKALLRILRRLTLPPHFPGRPRWSGHLHISGNKCCHCRILLQYICYVIISVADIAPRSGNKSR